LEIFITDDVIRFNKKLNFKIHTFTT